MAKQTITIDDLTGETIHADVESTTITVDGENYTVDLGEKSKAHLLAWLGGNGAYNYGKTEAKAETKAAPKAEAKRVRLTGEDKERFDKAVAEYDAAKKEQKETLQDFAKTAKGFEDYTVPARGIIKQDLLNAYYAANPDAVHYFGSTGVAAPVNTDYLT